MAFMMFGLEYSLHPNLVAIAQAGVPPCEDSDSTASARVLQFEGRVVVASTRRSFLQCRDRTLQGHTLMIKGSRLSYNRTHASVGCIAHGCSEQP